ncbi:MAG TPA: hypothetical protein VN328_10790 [Thermodesulfovibrionales bacterium]|nr:hypothetical protein [Thermodesulfovibrionales bacterium]
MRKPYCDTLVAVEKSKADIRKLLQKYNAANVQLAGEQKILSLRFSLKIRDEQHLLSFSVPTDARVRNRKKRNRNEQSSWRALYWTAKSLVEAIHFKISVSDEVQETTQESQGPI